MAVAHFKKRTGNRKGKFTWKRELQNELKNGFSKTLSEALTVAASKDLVRDLRST